MTVATPGDRRSIGELLIDADYHARQLLRDVTADDALPMLRTWGETVQAAAELWSVLPVVMMTSRADDAIMQRLETMSQAQHRSQVRLGWPGDGPGDERLLGIAETLQRATELANGPGRDVHATSDAGRADINAARMRVMHTLYVGAHAVGVAVRLHSAEAWARTNRHSPWRDVRGGPRGDDAATRLAAFEQIAGDYIGNRFSAAAAGQDQPPPKWGLDRLNQALASWDIQAHRTLAAAPTAPNLNLMTSTQAAVATASIGILAAAAGTGRLDGDVFERRLAPALEANQRAWHMAATRWNALSSRGDRGDIALIRAASEVRAAVHEIAFDRTRWATPEVMAGRVDLGEAAMTVKQAMNAAAELACVHRGICDREPGLTGPARTFAAWTREADTVSSTEASAVIDGDAAVVAPRDLHANRIVALPAPVRQTLIAEAELLVAGSEAAMSAGAAVPGLARSQVDQGEFGPGCPRCRPKDMDPRVGGPRPARGVAR